MPKTTISTVASLDTSPLIGTWELIESTNFDEYMKALGIFKEFSSLLSFLNFKLLKALIGLQE
jgi:hypothetical protein